MTVQQCNCQSPDTFHPAGDEKFCTRYRLMAVPTGWFGVEHTVGATVVGEEPKLSFTIRYPYSQSLATTVRGFVHNQFAPPPDQLKQQFSLKIGSGADSAMGTAFAKLARSGELKLSPGFKLRQKNEPDDGDDGTAAVG